MIEALKSVAAKLKKNTSEITNEVQKVRAAISEKRRELRAATDSPPPPADIEARVRALVRRTGERWLAEEGLWLVKKLGAAAPRPGAPVLPWMSTEAPPWGAMCAGSPEAAEALLLGVASRVKYTAGPALADRDAVLARLAAELAALEAQEEKLVDELGEAGVAVAHRPEVLRRRQEEARRVELEEERVEDRARRQEAVDLAHEQRRPGRSAYLATGKA